MKYVKFLWIWLLIVAQATAQPVKILFDATKAEMAGNADWVIDADAYNIGFSAGNAQLNGGFESNPQRMPTPAQNTINASTPETYWAGGISNWAIDCVKRGYYVETLPFDGKITYNDTSNAQDLSLYHIFIVVEPNIQFTASEKVAILNFVKNGGSLFMVSDHTISDRNNDGWDSPAIWNDLMQNNTVQADPFGISFDLANFSQTSTNITTNTNDSLIFGAMGNVTAIKWSNGTSISIEPQVNPTVRASVFRTGIPSSATGGIMVAFARFGLGKVVAIGDSSPCDDGTGDPNDVLYNGYTADVNGDHQRLLMNATIWLATSNSTVTAITPIQTLFDQFKIIGNPNSAQQIRLLVQLKSPQQVTAKLFSCNGSLVHEQVLGTLNTSPQQITLTHNQLTKGVYVLQMQVGKKTTALPVLLL